MVKDNLLCLLGTAPNTPLALVLTTGTTVNGSTITLARGGVPEYASMVLSVTVPTAGGADTPIYFEVQVSTDNGSTWKRIAALQNNCRTLGRFESAVGFYDAVPEAATTAVCIRGSVTYATIGSASNASVLLWLTSRGG
jgi:hypothetical protein